MNVLSKWSEIRKRKIRRRKIEKARTTEKLSSLLTLFVHQRFFLLFSLMNWEWKRVRESLNKLAQPERSEGKRQRKRDEAPILGIGSVFQVPRDLTVFFRHKGAKEGAQVGHERIWYNQRRVPDVEGSSFLPSVSEKAYLLSSSFFSSLSSMDSLFLLLLI